jgi:hypothetical protein
MFKNPFEGMFGKQSGKHNTEEQKKKVAIDPQTGVVLTPKEAAEMKASKENEGWREQK